MSNFIYNKNSKKRWRYRVNEILITTTGCLNQSTFKTFSSRFFNFASFSAAQSFCLIAYRSKGVFLPFKISKQPFKAQKITNALSGLNKAVW